MNLRSHLRADGGIGLGPGLGGIVIDPQARSTIDDDHVGSAVIGDAVATAGSRSQTGGRRQVDPGVLVDAVGPKLVTIGIFAPEEQHIVAFAVVGRGDLAVPRRITGRELLLERVRGWVIDMGRQFIVGSPAEDDDVSSGAVVGRYTNPDSGLVHLRRSLVAPGVRVGVVEPDIAGAIEITPGSTRSRIRRPQIFVCARIGRTAAGHHETKVADVFDAVVGMPADRAAGWGPHARSVGVVDAGLAS